MRIHISDPMCFKPKAGVLNLRDQSVTDDDIGNIILFLKAHPEVNALYLDKNTITDAGATLLATHDGLQLVTLCNNKLTIEGARALLANKTIDVLELAHNNIQFDASDHAVINQHFFVRTTQLSFTNVCRWPHVLEQEKNRIHKRYDYLDKMYSAQCYDITFIQAIGLECLKQVDMFTLALKTFPENVIAAIGFIYLSYLRTNYIQFPKELVTYLHDQYVLTTEAMQVARVIPSREKDSDVISTHQMDKQLKSFMAKYPWHKLICAALKAAYPGQFTNLEAGHVVTTMQSIQLANIAILPNALNEEKKNAHLQALSTAKEEAQAILQEQPVGMDMSNQLLTLSKTLIPVLQNDHYVFAMVNYKNALAQATDKYQAVSQARTFRGFCIYRDAGHGFFSHPDRTSVDVSEKKIARLRQALEGKHPSYALFKCLMSQKPSPYELEQVRVTTTQLSVYQQFMDRLDEELIDAGIKSLRLH